MGEFYGIGAGSFFCRRVFLGLAAATGEGHSPHAGGRGLCLKHRRRYIVGIAGATFLARLVLRLALRLVALRFVALRLVALRFVALRFVVLRFVARRFVARRFLVLRAAPFAAALRTTRFFVDLFARRFFAGFFLAVIGM